MAVQHLGLSVANIGPPGGGRHCHPVVCCYGLCPEPANLYSLMSDMPAMLIIFVLPYAGMLALLSIQPHAMMLAAVGLHSWQQCAT
jgi:hypothetical protein